MTPEAIAKHQARRCRTDGVLIDAFAGAGGNSIQFAKYCHHVIAIDVDPAKIAIARHNAQVYGVEKKITFIQGDFLELAPRLQGDVIFLSPPWGGPQHSYGDNSTFDLESMIEASGVSNAGRSHI